MNETQSTEKRAWTEPTLEALDIEETLGGIISGLNETLIGANGKPGYHLGSVPDPK